MPDLSSYTEKYWSAPAVPLPPATPIRLKVLEVKLEEVGEDHEVRPVMYFSDDPRGLVLDGRRYAAMADGAGSANTDAWAGRFIEVWRGSGTFRKKPYERIELKCL